nr:hypothetical protein [Tanacetum cinerariifolium]
MIVDYIKNGPYVKRMIATPGEPDLPVRVPESFHEQTNEELTENDLKLIDANDQAIQTILLGLPKDVYAAVDSYETAKEIWERVQHMMKGSDIGEQEKKVKLFNEWEKFTSTDGESIESYYHHFMQLMNDLKRNKHFPENIASNLKFLNNLQPEWKRHVTIVRQTKNLHEADFTLIYDFLKMNQDEVNELRAERLAKSHDPLPLMAHSQNSFNFPITHKDQSSSSTHSQQSFPINNKYNPQPSLNQNFMQPPTTFLEDINDPTEAMNAVLILFAKAFQLTAPTNNNQRTSSNPRNRQIAQPNGRIQGAQNAGQNTGVQSGGNQNGLVVVTGIANQNGSGNVVAVRAEGIQLQAEEFDFMAAAGDLDEIEEVNANYILMANLQHASTSGTQLKKAPVYDTDGSAEVQLNDNCYDIEIFNMFTQEEQYTDILEPIPEPQLVPQNNNHVTYVAPSMVQSGGTVETLFSPNEETRAHQETVYRNLVDQVAQEEMIKLGDLGADTPSFVDVPSDLQTELDRTNEKLERCIIKKEKEYAVLWNNCALNTLDPLNQKLESKIVELEFQVVNYECEISHLKTTYKNLFDSIKSNRVHAKLLNLVYENAQLRARLFENTSEPMNNTSGTSVTPQVDKPKLITVTPCSKKLHAPILSHSVPQPREFNVMKHKNVIAPGMFKINPSQTSRVDLVPNKQSNASIRTNPITNSQRHVTIKENSSEVKKNVTVEDHRRTLLLSKNQKTMSSECNNIKLAIRNDKSKIVSGTCKQCLVTSNLDACLLSSVNALNSRANNMCANVPLSANQKRHRTQVWKPKQVGSKERLACKPRLPRLSLKWSPSGRSFDLKGKLVTSNETNCPNDDTACTSNPQEPMRKRFPNSTVFLGRLSKFVCGLGHNLFSVGQFCDADLEVAFRRNTFFIRDLDGVDLLKGNRSTNLYTINLYDMASASPICLMARATPTKSWLWHQRLSHLNFNTINDLAKNDLISSLPNFKYTKEHLCPSCEQGKSKRASHPPKPVPNSKQWLHLLHMDLCGPMRVVSINEVIKNFLKKIYVRLQALVIIVRTDNGTEFKNHVLKGYFDSVGITHETSAAKTPQQNGVVERRNCTLVEAARTMLIFSHAPLFLWAEAVATACYTQNHSIIHRSFNKTPYELIQGRKPDISYLHVFGALCYPKNDHEDIGKLGAKGDIGFFIGYSANSVAYRVYNRWTKKITETMNVTFDELSAMAFEQNSSRPGLQIPRVIPAAPVPVVQNLQAPTASMSFQDSAPVPSNSSNTPVSSRNVDVPSQQHAQQQRNLISSPTASAVDNVPNAMFEGDLFVNPFATPSTESTVSSTQYVNPSNMHTFYQLYLYDYQWTKDHPLEQVIGEPSRPVLTRSQLKTDGDMCIYALTISIMKPKSVKEALTDPAWIKSIRFNDDILVVQVYVDDIIFGSTDPRYATLFSDLMNSRFKMSMIGEMTFFLGLQVNQSPSGIFVNQSKYVHEILKKYGLNTCDIVGTPMDIKDKLDLDQIRTLVDATKYRSMIGALMYLTSSRPNIVHTTCDSGFELIGFSDADYAGCKDTFKSTSGGAQFLGEKLLTDYGYHFDKNPIYCDSKSAIAISYNPVQHSRTKHIAVRYHFIKEHVEKGTIELYFVKIDYQLADIFTNALPVDRFNYLVRRLGLGLQRKENVHPCTFILHNRKFTSSRSCA